MLQMNLKKKNKWELLKIKRNSNQIKNNPIQQIQLEQMDLHEITFPPRVLPS